MYSSAMTHLTRNSTHLTNILIVLVLLLDDRKPTKLPNNFKSLVIQEWLKGVQRDNIAGDNGLSAGSVTNIVNEWRDALGFSAADELRDGCYFKENRYNRSSMCNWF